jgi:RNA polymerase sigma-B factor
VTNTIHSLVALNAPEMSEVEVTDLQYKYFQTRDAGIRSTLWSHYRGLAKALARRLTTRRDEVEDVDQVAAFALLKAVDRFDPNIGTRFSTFAWKTIEGEIRRYFRDTGAPVHISRSLRERCTEVRAMIEHLTHTQGHSPTVAEVGAALKLEPEEVIEAMEVQNSFATTSFVGDTSDSPTNQLRIDELGGLDNEFSNCEDRETGMQLLRQLSGPEQQVFVMRFLCDMKQREIADRIGCSQMHVSRILTRATERLRALSQDAIAS